MSSLRSSGALALLGALIAAAPTAPARAQSFTPAEGEQLISYTSIADSPFFGDGVACYALETFPDGEQGTAGWSFTPGADAGIVEATPGNWVLQQNTIGVITLNFDPDDDGNYPTRVGFVWTGGDPKNPSQIRLDVISGGTQSASRTFTKLPPNPSDDPDSNLFFGVGWSTGLQQVRITFNPFFGVANQIDDIQFSVETNVVGISSAETELNQAGGKGSFSVSSIATACTWTPTADVPWITDLTASGSGDGKVLFTVEPNPEPFVRTGTITVGEFTHTVTQSPADCVVTGLTPESAEFTAAGGDASFTVSTSGPECSWIATTTDDWITIGQSTGTGKAEMVTYTVAENPGITPRTGSITVKKQTFIVTQTGAECAVTGIEPTEAAFEAAGGSETFAVTMNGATCPWSAVLEEGVDWIELDVASGTGDGAVEYTVQENTSTLERTATIAVGDQTFTVTQAAPCAIVAIDPTGATPDTAGGAASFAVDMNGESCPWTAVLEEGVDWIELDVASGTGDGTVEYTVAENTASDGRTGTITVEGLKFIVTQDGTGCVVTSLEPVAASVEAAAGTGTFDVFVSGETCEWTAVSNDLWITIAAESGSGTGNGTVEYAFEANTDPIERTGTITVGDQTFTVEQAAGCEITFINPAIVELDTTAQSSSFSVGTTSNVDCTWTASTNTSWITLDTDSGIGTGDVLFSVEENTGTAERIGTIQISGFASPFTVIQEGVPCEVLALSPETETFDSAGGNGSFEVQTSGETCDWTASTNDTWITLDTITGTGTGPVDFTVAEHFGSEDRTGTITVGGLDFTVVQTAACSVTSIDPETTDADAEGGEYTFDVVVGESTCTWSATTGEAWIDLTVGSGEGDGAVTFTVDPNDTALVRTGTITVGGLVHTVNQAAGECAVSSLSPSDIAFGAAGGPGDFEVFVNGQDCAWSASTTDDWIVATGSGTGDGSVAYTVDPNTGPSARSGSILVEIPGVAGEADEKIFEITQAAACTVTAIDPESVSVPETGGSESFSVTFNNQACEWTATTTAAWIQISTPSGTGDGTIEYVVAANPSAEPRTGTISIGEAEHTVNQQASCAVLALDPSEATLDATGGSGMVSVVTSRPDCEWTATTNATWIALENASGTGAGTFDYTVGEYDGIVDRTGVVTVGERTFTITQSSSCVITLDPTEASFEFAGGSGSIAVSTSLETCEWTATTEASWITIVSGSGAGEGTVEYDVAPWDGPVDRTGTISIGDSEFPVVQTAACVIEELGPDPGTFGPGGGMDEFTVTTSTPECAWTVESDADWLVLSPTEGVGTGSVMFTVPVYSGSTDRTATVTVGDKSITIDQSAFCSVVDIDPLEQTFEPVGGSGSIAVTTSTTNCEWTATTEADWVTIGEASGTGNGTVEYTVAENSTSEERVATITIGDSPFTVRQQTAGCVVEALVPASADYPVEGGNGSFSITLNDETCTWTAVSDVPWITVDTPSGDGSAAIAYTVAENGGITQREGTITVLGESHTVVQAAGECMATSVDPETASFSIAGGDGLFGVTLNDESCEWTAVSDAEWLVVLDPSGTGSGSIGYTVAENDSGSQRVGTIAVAGLVHTVNQAGEIGTIFESEGDYLSLADSPLFGTGQSCFEVEYFPGGALSVDGLSFNAGAAAIVPGAGVAPGTHVLRSSTAGVIQLSIDSATVAGGELPTAFGFVWTGGGAGTTITITATSGSGLVETNQFEDLGPNNPNDPADNRFFGIEWNERIEDVLIEFSPPSASYQIDQIQFAIAPQECETGEPDFNGDGWNDLVVQSLQTGEIRIQLLLDGEGAGLVPVGRSIDPSYYIRSIGGWSGGSARPAIAWRNIFDGRLFGWRMGGAVYDQQYQIFPTVWTGWLLLGSGDLDDDGTDDFVWQNDEDGRIGYWTMGPDGQPTAYLLFADQASVAWDVIGVGDFNADGRPDLLWRNIADGSLGVWYLAPPAEDGSIGYESIGIVTSDAPNFSLVAGVADYDNDGIADILWQQDFTNLQLWFMEYDSETGELSIRQNVTPDLGVDTQGWRVRGG